MAQSNYVIANTSAPVARAQMNTVFVSIATNNSGATAPATTFPFLWWYDTTAHILKMRNSSDDAWIDIAEFDQGDGSFFILTDFASQALAEGGSDAARPMNALRTRQAIDARVPTLRGQSVIVQERTSAGAARSLSTASGGWATLRVNTDQRNAITGATVDTANYQVTLPAGYYECSAFSLGGDSSAFQTRLRDITNTETLLLGLTMRNGGSEFSSSSLEGEFELSGSTIIELQQTASGRGAPGYSLSSPNVWSQLRLRRLG